MTYVPTTHRVGVTNPQSQGRAGGTHTSGPALAATNESATEAGTGVGLETDLLLGLTTSLRSVTRLGPPYIKDSLSRLRITFAFDSLLELETLCCSATTEKSMCVQSRGRCYGDPLMVNIMNLMVNIMMKFLPASIWQFALVEYKGNRS